MPDPMTDADPTEFAQSDEFIDVDLFEDTLLDDDPVDYEYLDVHHQGRSDLWLDLCQINPDDVPY